MIKKGYGAHRASGVFLFDDKQKIKIKDTYGEKGEQCGIVRKSMVAQKYISNPLLLDRNNKFDFRIFLLIASTDPIIAYYHDGFLKVSLKEFDLFSNDVIINKSRFFINPFFICREVYIYQILIYQKKFLLRLKKKILFMV